MLRPQSGRRTVPNRKIAEWKSKGLRAYQQRTKQADALITGAYLGGTNTRRVRRALFAVFGGAISKDTVSRVWRKVKGLGSLGMPARSPSTGESALYKLLNQCWRGYSNQASLA